MVFSLIAVVITGTFAWLTWRTQNTAMILTIGELDGMSVTLKPYQINASLTPTNDYTTQEYVNVTVENKRTMAGDFTLYYSINNIDTALIDDGFKYTIVKSTNNWSSQTVVKTGNFVSARTNQNMEIYTETVPGNNTTYKYRVYLWIDSSDGNQASMQGKTFNGELRASISENQYTLTINPNGGTYSGSSANKIITQGVNTYYGLNTPINGASNFNEWQLVGKGTLLRGNASGDGTPMTSNGVKLTETINQDTDGSQYTNYKFTNESVTSNTWPSLKYPHYNYILGHTYRISFDIKLNAYENLAYFDARHAFKDNDYYTAYGLVSTRIPITAVGQGWIHYTMDRTFDEARKTVVVSGTTYEYDVDPLFEIYVAINANKTGTVDFDIKNIMIEDITDNLFISTDTYGGYIYEFDRGNATLTANWGN